MTQIIQGIYGRAASAVSYTGHVLTRKAKGTMFDLAIHSLAQIALQRSIFPTLNPVRALIDITTMWSIQRISEILIVSSFEHSNFLSKFLSCVPTLYWIGAYRFTKDPSYALTDLAALAIIPSLYLLESGVGILTTNFQKFLEQREKDLLYKQLLEACREGNIEKASEAIQKGADPFFETEERFSGVYEAFASGNLKLILLMLEKAESFERLWNYVLLRAQPNQRLLNNLFNKYNSYEDLGTVDLFKVIINLFINDNIELFKELWKHFPENSSARKHEILKLALNCGSIKISKFLMSEGLEVIALENLKKKYNLNIHSFLSTLLSSINICIRDGGRQEIFKDYLNLTHVTSLTYITSETSEINLQNCTGIDHRALLNELAMNKCMLWETAVYLSLTEAKENLREEDIFGLRPLDYAILFDRNLGSAFLDFLIKYDRSLITLGTHHTCFHLAILAQRFDILLKLLKTVNESVVHPRKKSSLIFRELSGKNVQHQLPWLRIELLNRADAFGLTPLHYSLSLSLSLAYIDILLKAGAKDIPGSFIQGENECCPPIPSFLKKTALEMFPNIGEFEFASLTGSEFIQKAKQFDHNRGAQEFENLFDKCLQLLNGEKTYEELARTQ